MNHFEIKDGQHVHSICFVILMNWIPEMFQKLVKCFEYMVLSFLYNVAIHVWGESVLSDGRIWC